MARSDYFIPYKEKNDKNFIYLYFVIICRWKVIEIYYKYVKIVKQMCIEIKFPADRIILCRKMGLFNK